MHDVFVSYSRDDQAWVNQLLGCLDGVRVPYWLDKNQIPLSAKWRIEAEQGIEEATLFLICDSDHLRASGPCAWEKEIADQRGLPCHTALVGTDPRTQAEAIAKVWRAAYHGREARIDLLVRSRDWETEGRPKRALVGLIPRRRLRKGLVGGGHGEKTARDYLRASRRRSSRRAAMVTALVLAVFSGYIISKVVPAAQQIVAGYNTTEGGWLTSADDTITAADLDPYRGLQAAAALGSTENAVPADAIQAALASPVPDDAFTVPDDDLTFIQRPVSGTVIIRGAHGTEWARPTAATNQRTAHKLTTTLAPPGPVPQPATWKPGDSRVTVTRDGKLWRVITVSGPPAAAAPSPDGRWLAVATGRQVDLVDLDRGTVRSTLRGTPAPVTDLDWAATGDRLWAVAGHDVVSWRTRSGSPVLNEPGRWYQAIFPGAAPDTIWVASRDGDLRLVQLNGDTVSRTIHVNSISSASADRRSTMAAVVGLNNELWFIDLATGTTHKIPVPAGCVLGRPAFSPDSAVVYVPCLGDRILRFAASSGAQETPIPVQQGTAAMTVVPKTGDIVIADNAGDLVTYRAGAESALTTIPCRPAISAIAMDKDGVDILPVGLGTGQIACGSVRHIVGGQVRWDELDDAPTDSVLSLAAAFDPTGAEFAIGFSNGTIYLHPTENFLPSQTLTEVTGGIRDMITTSEPDGTSVLFVATRTGMLERIPLCPQCLSNKAMADRAEQTLRRAVELGIAPTALLQSATSPASAATASGS